MSRQKNPNAIGRTPEYHIWFNMMNRCYNPALPAFKNYGERGIAVCERWHVFANFYADMCPRPESDGLLTLDRKDNSVEYSKENCRWATWREQQRNRRSNRFHTINGETLCTTEWAERFGIPIARLNKRLDRGWSIEKALTQSRYHRLLTLNGETLSLTEWSRRLKISVDSLFKRVDKYKWPVERALTQPIKKQANNRF